MRVALFSLALTACPGTTIGPAPLETPTLVSVESFFGECGGPCQKTLEFDGIGLELTIADWGAGDPLAVQTGSLTDEGQSRVQEAEQSLAGVALDDVYGCPDCADGGGMQLTFAIDDARGESTWEFGAPPAELVEVDDLFTDLRDALEACGGTPEVMVGTGCEPFVWP